MRKMNKKNPALEEKDDRAKGKKKKAFYFYKKNKIK